MKNHTHILIVLTSDHDDNLKKIQEKLQEWKQCGKVKLSLLYVVPGSTSMYYMSSLTTHYFQNLYHQGADVLAQYGEVFHIAPENRWLRVGLPHIVAKHYIRKLRADAVIMDENAHHFSLPKCLSKAWRAITKDNWHAKPIHYAHQ